MIPMCAVIFLAVICAATAPRTEHLGIEHQRMQT